MKALRFSIPGFSLQTQNNWAHIHIFCLDENFRMILVYIIPWDSFGTEY
jgi:hypothetical protein